MNCCYIYTHNSPTIEKNGFFEDLLYKSIETLFLFYNKDIKNLYILIDNQIDENILNNIKNNINSINKYSINIIYKLVDLNITNIFKYPENNMNNDRINKIGLLKFFIPYLVDIDNILYIDCDILFNGNILKEIYEDFNENIIMKIFQNGWNSGLILFNCNKWREHKTLLNDIIEYYEKTPNITLVDNQVFDWLSVRNKKYKDIVAKNYDWKINYPLDINEFKEGYKYIYPKFDFTQYKYENMYIIHVSGTYEFKSKKFYEIYNYIVNSFMCSNNIFNDFKKNIIINYDKQ